MLEPRLGLLTSNFTELTTTATSESYYSPIFLRLIDEFSSVLQNNLTSLVSELSDELNATLIALMEASQIRVEILGRNFSAETADLERYQALAAEAVSLATRLWNSITSISNQVGGIHNII